MIKKIFLLCDVGPVDELSILYYFQIKYVFLYCQTNKQYKVINNAIKSNKVLSESLPHQKPHLGLCQTSIMALEGTENTKQLNGLRRTKVFFVSMETAVDNEIS